MLLSGDEFANTQFGNNNAYCQDNEISYLDWSGPEKEKDLFTFVKGLIAFRKAHPVLLGKDFDFGYNGTGYPELSFHGLRPWELDEKAAALSFAYLYAEDCRKYSLREDSFLYIMVNAHWEAHTFMLPVIPAGMAWYLSFDTGQNAFQSGSEKKLAFYDSIPVQPRSIIVLTGKR